MVIRPLRWRGPGEEYGSGMNPILDWNTEGYSREKGKMSGLAPRRWGCVLTVPDLHNMSMLSDSVSPSVRGW